MYLHSLRSGLEKLAKACDVVWHVHNDYFVARDLYRHVVHDEKVYVEHLDNIGGEDGVDVLQPRSGWVQSGQLRHLHRVVQLAGVPSLLPRETF